MGYLLHQNEFEVDLDKPATDVLYFAETTNRRAYNPRVERHTLEEQWITSTCKSVKAGEELLENYLSFGGVEHFKEQVMVLRDQCLGALGEIELFQAS